MPKTIKAKGPTIRMRVTEAERRLLLARRGAEPSDRPPVISGYRSPWDGDDLVDIVGSFAETNWGGCEGFDVVGGHRVVDVQTEEGTFSLMAVRWREFPDILKPDELEAVQRYRLASAAASIEPEFRAVLSMARKPEGEAGGYEDIDLEVRIVKRSVWEQSLKGGEDGRPYAWSSVTLEDGRVLAMRPASTGREWEPWGEDDAGDEVDAIRRKAIRNRIWALLDADPHVKCLEIRAGGGGQGRMMCSYDKASVCVDVRNYTDGM